VIPSGSKTPANGRHSRECSRSGAASADVRSSAPKALYGTLKGTLRPASPTITRPAPAYPAKIPQIVALKRENSGFCPKKPPKTAIFARKVADFLSLSPALGR
jgi:hypothetical protein